MENMDKKECGSGMCGGACKSTCCGGMSSMSACGMGCHVGKHHLMKKVIKIFIVILIFWCGFRMGSMVGFIKANYRIGMMDGYYSYDNNGDSAITSPTQ
jgi:hypothetical protein